MTGHRTAFLLLALCAGCGRAGAALAGDAPRPAGVAPAAAVLADATRLAARAEALEAGLRQVLDRRELAAWCHPGCPAGVASVRVLRGGDEVACTCVRLPSLGRHPLSSPRQARAPEERGQRLSQSNHDGARRGERGLAVAGLSPNRRTP